MKSKTKALAECRAAWEAHPEAKWAWCLHHELRLEPLTEPYEARIAYILKHKPKDEQATRLNNFRPVVSKLPAEIIKAHGAYAEAWEACDKAREAFDKAWEAYREAYDKAGEAYREAYDKATEAYHKAGEAYVEAVGVYREAILANTTKLQALHTKDVPQHTWNGNSIF